MGWGTSPWGTGVWGAGGTAFALAGAVASSVFGVLVTVTLPARAVSASSPGDALNPAVWAVTNLGTGASVPVLAVTQISTTVYELTLSARLGGSTVWHRVTSTTVCDAGGAVIGAPTTADFLGLTDTSALASASRPRDLANFPAPRNPLGGTLQVTAAGDYREVDGAQWLRQLIMRRLFSTPGEWFHMPDYGVGLRVQEPMGTAGLRQLKAQIERQVRREPEIETVAATLTMSAAGVLTIVVRALLVSGTELTAQATIPLVTL